MDHGVAKAGALNSTLRRLLDGCGFGRRFVQAQGMWLVDSDGRRFLDGYAQYGALALGHNHPALVATLRDALAIDTPCMLQPYPAPHAQTLALLLAGLSGLPHCLFGSTGAEVVEAALKAVRRASGRPLIVAARGSYHGKTLGALAATFQAQHRRGFGPLPRGFVPVPFGDLDALQAVLDARGPQIAAVLLEPIQGERGVHLPPSGYLAAVRALCTQHGIALILDEIQTGLGRTGRLFAYQHDAIQPDVLLLAKALGGGLFPLSAALFADAWFPPALALHHGSTFANHNLGCRVGIQALALLLGCGERDLLQGLSDGKLPGESDGGVIAQARRSGAHLQARLAGWPARFPRSVAAVRGRGLMAAMDLQPCDGQSGFLLSYLSNQGLLAYALAALAAEQSGVLILPSLGSRQTLRLAPPLIAEPAHLDLLCDGIEHALARLEARDSAAFARGLGSTRPLPFDGTQRVAEALPLPCPMPKPRPPSRRTYAFLIHPGSLDDLLASDPGLQPLAPAEQAAFAHFLSALPAGLVLRAPTLRTPSGREAEGYLIALPRLPSQMLRAGRRRLRSEIQQAVDLAAALGAQVVGLGGFTTPYSRRGLDVIGRGPHITTGNSLTAVMAIAALCRHAQQRSLPIAQQRVAIVGARGSVGALCARLLLAHQPRSLLLVGNPHSPLQPLVDLANSLRAQSLAAIAATHQDAHRPSAPSSPAPPVAIEVSSSLDSLRGCSLIVAASGAGRPIIEDPHVGPGSIVCDVARPFDVSPAVRARRDVTVFDGGLVALPDPSLCFGRGNLVGLPPGTQLACLSETIVLALSDEGRDFGVGDDIPLADAQRIAVLAQHHGFRLAPLSVASSVTSPVASSVARAASAHEQAA